MDYRRMNGVDVRIIRIFNTYGPRMNPNDGRVVSNFIVQALKGEDITIYRDWQTDPEFSVRGRPGGRNGAHDEYGRFFRPCQPG